MSTYWNSMMLSRYGLPLVVPDPFHRESDLLGLLQQIGARLGDRPVLIPTSDAFVLFMSKWNQQLSEYYDFNVADYETVLTLTNKRLQYAFATKAGIRIPLTMYPTECSIEEVSRAMRYPCIMKPYFSHLWHEYRQLHHESRWGKVVEARSANELLRTYHEIEKSGLEFLVQEEIGGPDDQLYDMLVYLDRASEPLAMFTKHKLRIHPLTFGVSSLAVGEWEPDVARIGMECLRKLKYHGVVSPEFKRDPEDGQLKLIEVNPRSILTTGLAVASGVDIPFIVYQDSRGERVEKALGFQPGIKWISFDREFKAFVELWRLGNLDLLEWLHSWRGRRCFAVFAVDDPLPACTGLWEFARSNLSRFIRERFSGNHPENWLHQ